VAAVRRSAEEGSLDIPGPDALRVAVDEDAGGAVVHANPSAVIRDAAAAGRAAAVADEPDHRDPRRAAPAHRPVARRIAHRTTRSSDDTWLQTTPGLNSPRSPTNARTLGAGSAV
jgi:hypothetical protein